MMDLAEIDAEDLGGTSAESATQQRPRGSVEPLGSDAGRRGSASCLSSNEEDLVSSGGAPLGSGQPAGHNGEVQAQPLREALGVGQA